jgi:tyrosine-protein phosphatase SIW14
MLWGLSSRKRLLPGMLLAVSVMPLTMFAAEPAPGIGNFHRVNARIYRGAQPTAAGFHSLADLGVKTVIDVRDSGSRSVWERKLVESAGMTYVNIPLSGISAPQPQRVREILALLEDAASAPVFIHCRQGADRTGTLIACYRIAHDGWDNRKALREAQSLGLHWFEFSMKNYVLSFHVSRPPVVAAFPAPAAR